MMVRFSVWLCISKHIVSLLPFLVLFVFFFGNTKTVYNIKNNKLCFNDIKNLSLGLCSICINTDSTCKLVVYAYLAKPSWQIFHIMKTQCIILYLLYKVVKYWDKFSIVLQ